MLQIDAVVTGFGFRAGSCAAPLHLASDPLPSGSQQDSRHAYRQFTRADYAAIGLSNENDPISLRLRAAGPFGRIVAYDLDISDEATQAVCPAVYMLHVARTGKVESNPVECSLKLICSLSYEPPH